MSTHLPIPLLLGVRLAARRPRRLALNTLSVTVTVAGIIAIVIEHARLAGTTQLVNPQNALTAIAARIGSRQPTSQILQAELS